MELSGYNTGGMIVQWIIVDNLLGESCFMHVKELFCRLKKKKRVDKLKLLQ